MKITGAIAIVRIPIYARLVRGRVLSIKEKEYIEACRARPLSLGDRKRAQQTRLPIQAAFENQVK